MSYHICYVTPDGCAGINITASSYIEAVQEALKRFEEKEILYVSPQQTISSCKKS